jgi:hypothetical protein
MTQVTRSVCTSPYSVRTGGKSVTDQYARETLYGSCDESEGSSKSCAEPSQRRACTDARRIVPKQRASLWPHRSSIPNGGFVKSVKRLIKAVLIAVPALSILGYSGTLTRLF